MVIEARFMTWNNNHTSADNRLAKIFFTVGLSATIFKIVKYEDNWVGAKACDPVLLPEQPEEFEHFLSEHLQRLMNLLVHI
jgi:hypothetical protein